jgi:hypothetical protein
VLCYVAGVEEGAAEPGWYGDPWKVAERRYWDGAQWTGHVQPQPSAAVTPEPAVAVDNPAPVQGGTVMRTPAWIWGSFTSHPGMLELAGGRLAFRPDQAGGKSFDAPLAEISGLSFPGWAGATNLKLQVGGEKLRVVFIQPKNAAPAAAHAVDIVGWELLGQYAGIAASAHAALSYPAGFKSGKAWKAVLMGADG